MDPDLPDNDVPGPADHLRVIGGSSGWVRRLAVIGAFLILLAVLLTIFAPSVLWFLAYPLLIVGALGALAYAAAFLIRQF